MTLVQKYFGITSDANHKFTINWYHRYLLTVASLHKMSNTLQQSSIEHLSATGKHGLLLVLLIGCNFIILVHKHSRVMFCRRNPEDYSSEKKVC